jgi:hypothetical protein
MTLKCITKIGSAVVSARNVALPIVINRKTYNNLLKCHGVEGKLEYVKKYNIYIFTQDACIKRYCE